MLLTLRHQLMEPLRIGLLQMLQAGTAMLLHFLFGPLKRFRIRLLQMSEFLFELRLTLLDRLTKRLRVLLLEFFEPLDLFCCRPFTDVSVLAALAHPVTPFPGAVISDPMITLILRAHQGRKPQQSHHRQAQPDTSHHRALLCPT